MRLLIIAPHPDDEVLGCGGTIAKAVYNDDEVYVCIVTKGTDPLFSKESVETVREECLSANKYLGVKKTIFLDFPAVMLETVPRYKLNDAFVKVIQEVCPDEVYMPHRGDMQLDHKIIVDAVMVAVRPKYQHIVKRIYSYETLSETGWDIPNVENEFIPNVYSDISDFLDKKIEAMKIYQTQLTKFPNARSLESLKALAIYRGTNVKINAAESFCLIREII